MGKYKDTIKEAIIKYKNEFNSFENQISYSNFYNDVQNSKYLKLEDCLQVVYTKIKGKPLSQYKNEGINNNNNNNNDKDNDNEYKLQQTVKYFVEDIFNWVLNK